jgi:hypothetical protein
LNSNAFDSTLFEKNSVMNPTSFSRTEEFAPVVVREQIDFQESRLWERARLNLMLLYGGRRGGSGNGQGNPSSVAASPFGNGVVEI